jgi:DNA-binding CsgD family transcriptional regulator
VVKIDEKHPIFDMQPMVQGAMEGLWQQHGISYFQYLRCYHDGSFSILCNDLRLVKEFETVEDEQLIYSSFEEEHQNKQKFWFFWDESLPDFPVQLAKEKMGIHHGLTLVRRAKQHYDMIGFALPKTIENPHGHYLTILPQLELFIAQFEQQESEHIQFIEANKIVLPKPYQDPNHNKLCIKNGRLDIIHQNITSHVTLQELHCIRGLQLSYSIKKIAHKLNISPRTVETYLERVYDRTGLKATDAFFLNL